MYRLNLLNSHFTSQHSTKLIKVSVQDKVALVEMNPTAKIVFLNLDVMNQLSSVLEQIEKDPQISVVILTGNDKSFAAGADIKELKAIDQSSHTFDDYFERIWWKVVPKFKKPLIAAIKGICFGGGLELALMADILISSDDASLSLPEINLGVIPGSGGTQRLSKAVGKSRAMQMILTGERINAQQAKEYGIVNSVHPKDKLIDEAMKIAKVIAQKSQLITAIAKKAVNFSQDMGVTQGNEVERSLFTGLLSTNDKKEGINAFFEKRQPKFTNS